MGGWWIWDGRGLNVVGGGGGATYEGWREGALGGSAPPRPLCPYNSEALSSA